MTEYLFHPGQIPTGNAQALAKALPYPGLRPQSLLRGGLAEFVALFDIFEERPNFFLTRTQRPPFCAVGMKLAQGGPNLSEFLLGSLGFQLPDFGFAMLF